jgi:DNA polymerase elongation subunit (family B)
LSELEKLINELPEEDIEYLEKTVFKEDGSIISKAELEKLIEEESTAESQKDAVQFALKINLNSVYGVQIMPHFKFADEWQALGASTTLTGRVLSKFGLIETIEQYFNPERESRFEFPLLDNIIVAADDDDFFADPETQKLRSAVISDTDSVTGDSIVNTDTFGALRIDELVTKASRVEEKDGKKFYFYDDFDLGVTNYIGGQVKFDDVEFIYSHTSDKQLYEIELEDGKTIKVTEDHSIMVLDENGEPTIEKKPFELSENDVCVVI